jgi:hypothetical protein
MQMGMFTADHPLIFRTLQRALVLLLSAPTLFSSKTNGPNVDIQLWVEDC